jgi:hypothetical protein
MLLIIWKIPLIIWLPSVGDLYQIMDFFLKCLYDLLDIIDFNRKAIQEEFTLSNYMHFLRTEDVNSLISLGKVAP